LKYIIFILLFIQLSCANTANSLYEDVLRDIEAGSIDFAFMKLNNYLRDYPNSPEAPEIKFALIEYYFQTDNYRGAIDLFTDYLIGYPEEKNHIFAQAILYRILLEYNGESELIAELKERFFSKPIFNIFSGAKIKTYKSILNNNYKIADSASEIVIYKNNKPFIKVSPQ